MPLTDSELTSLQHEKTVYDPAWSAVYDQAREANALRSDADRVCRDVVMLNAENDAVRKRCEDLELMLRDQLEQHDRCIIPAEVNGFVLVKSLGCVIALDGDGTGLPILTDEAREALRGK